MMKSFLREPLLHFLVAGTLLFVLYGYLGAEPETEKARITIGSGQVEQLREAWKKQWRRPPTEEELRNLIDKHIEEEVLYREALAMGLEKDDTIVRRRLAQKIRFLIQDIADQAQPSREELMAFFESHPDQYGVPEQISFTHVYFSPDRRGSAVLRDAQTECDKLNSENIERAPDRGDRFMLRHDYMEISQVEAARLFGGEFAIDIMKLKPGQWHCPIRSGYGVHIVRILDSIPSRMPDFSQVQDRVRHDFIEARRRKMNETAIKELKSRYRVDVDEKAKPRDRRASSAVPKDSSP